jgi:hypothetical protein
VKDHIFRLRFSHAGVFGTGHEQKLKERKDLNNQVSDVLPETDRGNHHLLQQILVLTGRRSCVLKILIDQGIRWTDRSRSRTPSPYQKCKTVAAMPNGNKAGKVIFVIKAS